MSALLTVWSSAHATSKVTSKVFVAQNLKVARPDLPSTPPGMQALVPVAREWHVRTRNHP